MTRIIEIEINCCGDCPYYNYKKHRCDNGATDEGNATDAFYADCPLSFREVTEGNNADKARE